MEAEEERDVEETVGTRAAERPLWVCALLGLAGAVGLGVAIMLSASQPVVAVLLGLLSVWAIVVAVGS